MTDIRPMDAVARTNTQSWRDTTPGGFQIITSGHWEDDTLVESMHRNGSNELNALYQEYDQLVAGLEVDSATATSFNEFRAKYFNDGAAVRSAPQLQLQPTDWKLNTGAAVGAGALAGIGGGVLLARQFGKLGGGLGGAALAAAAGFGAIKLVGAFREMRHEGRIEDFQQQYDQHAADPQLRDLLAFEQKIFETERDPAREGSVQEKLALLSASIVAHHDDDGGGSVDIEGPGKETADHPERSMGEYNVENSDRNDDGVVTVEEVERRLAGYTEQLSEDDTAIVNAPRLDANQDGVVDQLRWSNPPGDATAWIHAYWT